MANDPQLVYPKNPVSSRTLMLNLVGSAVAYLGVRYGLGEFLTPELQVQVSLLIMTLVMSGANIAVRLLTGGRLSFAAPLVQTPAVDLPPGTAVVVSTSAAASLTPAQVTAIPVGDSVISVQPPSVFPIAPPPAVVVTPITTGA